MIIKMAQSNLHDLFQGELEMYLLSQYPGFSLRKLPNKRVIKLGGIRIPKKMPTVIDYILDCCDKNDNILMKLRRFLPSFKSNRELIIRKMRRKGLDNWYLYEDVKNKRKFK